VKSATQPRNNGAERRLLTIDAVRNRLGHDWAKNFSEQLSADDLVILNDAATLPASLRFTNREGELRLVAHTNVDSEYLAVLFGAADYRIPTEEWPPPPRATVGEELTFTADLGARVVSVDRRAARLLRIRFSRSGAELLRALYRAGRPIQYSYVQAPLGLWDVQNRFAARPWAFEAPSAGFVIDGEQLSAFARRGIRVARLTHAAGISSTGSPELDRLLPLPERFEIPASTILELERSRRAGGRVVAIGTSVVRALESSAFVHGSPRAGRDEAQLLLDQDYEPRVVDAVLSGMHEVGSSHFSLLEAFAERPMLERALTAAEAGGYLTHEFGDVCFVVSGRRQRRRAPAAA
jgi:S-adenosylmethionine:tRNA ribosyltransferase-isomerase